MKRIHLLYIILFFIVLNVVSCAPHQWKCFRIHNLSSKTIRVCGAYILPDTKLPEKKLSTTEILPGKSNMIYGSQLNDDALKRFETEKVTLFIIDDQVFQTVSWDTIRKYDMVLKRYEINMEDYSNLKRDINDKGWGLPYP